MAESTPPPFPPGLLEDLDLGYLVLGGREALPRLDWARTPLSALGRSGLRVLRAGGAAPRLLAQGETAALTGRSWASLFGRGAAVEEALARLLRRACLGEAAPGEGAPPFLLRGAGGAPPRSCRVSLAPLPAPGDRVAGFLLGLRPAEAAAAGGLLPDWLAETAPPFHLAEPGGRLVWASRALEDLFGLLHGTAPGLLEEDLTGATTPLAPLRRRALEEGEARLQLRSFRRDGREFPLEIHWRVCAVGPEPLLLAGLYDRSREEALAEERRARRRAEAGRASEELLAGLVESSAHRVQNLLTRLLCEAESPAAETGGALAAGLLRLRQEIRRLQLAARPVPAGRRAVDAAVSLREARAWLEGALPPGAALELRLPAAEARPALLDEGLWLRSLAGLLAFLGRSQGGRGRLVLGFEEGDRPCLLVEAPGTGVEPALLGRLLGGGEEQEGDPPEAAALRRIGADLQAAGAAVEVLGRPAQGLQLRLGLLPAAPAAGAAPAPAGGGGVLLVADDEEGIHEAVRSGLAPRGWRVRSATGGLEALGALRGPDPGCDVVLLDLAMPGLDGWSVLGEIRRRHPALPVLLTSGHAAELPRILREDPGLAFLPKPWTPEELDAALRRLQARAGAAAEGAEA